eukprot:TRINITY_DN11687_c0_g1_i1.p1 TRINITY_DN11687_c0_g1~~TRINITY_DN11687_c0_g1_i1.p1  ORF type:complete len:434 (-),score=84.18 TRINITY_DN11687_c0_g1_i1:58-1335(-)
MTAICNNYGNFWDPSSNELFDMLNDCADENSLNGSPYSVSSFSSNSPNSMSSEDFELNPAVYRLDNIQEKIVLNLPTNELIGTNSPLPEPILHIEPLVQAQVNFGTQFPAGDLAMYTYTPAPTLPVVTTIPELISNPEPVVADVPLTSAAPKSKKYCRKRTRGEVEDLSFVSLDRDTLLKISSKTLEERTKELNKIRKLTPSEQREVKRQRRLVKNREYAQASRVKKKVATLELKQQIDSLTVENNELKSNVYDLSVRLANLEAENAMLKMALQGKQQVEFNSKVEPTVYEPVPQASSSTHVPLAVKTGSLCLLMIALCFTVFFNPLNRSKLYEDLRLTNVYSEPPSEQIKFSTFRRILNDDELSLDYRKKTIPPLCDESTSKTIALGQFLLSETLYSKNISEPYSGIFSNSSGVIFQTRRSLSI